MGIFKPSSPMYSCPAARTTQSLKTAGIWWNSTAAWATTSSNLMQHKVSKSSFRNNSKARFPFVAARVPWGEEKEKKKVGEPWVQSPEHCYYLTSWEPEVRIHIHRLESTAIMKHSCLLSIWHEGNELYLSFGTLALTTVVYLPLLLHVWELPKICNKCLILH